MEKIEYKIEKNIEKKKTSCQKYPFDKMEVGDSFEFNKQERTEIATAAAQYAKRNGVKFSSKKQDEGKVRIWRIK